MDSNENFRSELQALRKSVEDLRVDLQRANRPRARRRLDHRKQAIKRLIDENPEITNLQICRAMDKHQEKSADSAPLPSWNCPLWQDAYHRVTNRVHSYISSIRRRRL